MTSSSHDMPSRQSTPVRAAEPQPKAERDPEGGARRFPSPNDITGGPLIVCVSEGVGYASIVYSPVQNGIDSRSDWISMDGAVEVKVDRWGEVVAERPRLSDLDKVFVNLERANKRAKKEFLHYCVKNGLTTMWTLTYRPPQPVEKAVVKRDVNVFFRDWRDQMTGGRNFPYAYLLERHKSGGLHVHIAVQKGFTDFHRLSRAWGRGRIRYDEARNTSHLSGRELSRCLARYLSKYLNKSFLLTDDHTPGEHRYETAQSFKVVKVRRRFSKWSDALEWLASVDDEFYELAWSSDDDPLWAGPPVWILLSG